MKTHKATTNMSKETPYEILCDYTPLRTRNSSVYDNLKFRWAWKEVNCPECIKTRKIVREK